jgi:hypothetical protein
VLTRHRHDTDPAGELALTRLHRVDQIVEQRQRIPAGHGVAMEQEPPVGQFHTLRVDPRHPHQAVADRRGDRHDRRPAVRVLPGTGRPGDQRVPALQGLVPVGAVLGTPGPHPPQVDTRPVDAGQRRQLAARNDLGEQVAALVVDRHRVRGELADLAAGHPMGHGQRAGGLVEVLRGLPRQLDVHLVPAAAGADLDDAG